MPCVFLRLTVLPVALFTVSCTTSKRGDVQLHAPMPPAQELTTSSFAPEANLPAGQYAMLVDSEPAGGIVVVNGVPVGRAPQRVVLSGTSLGFFREDYSLKVRFVAADTDHTSRTIEEVLTPLDKIPASVRFTPAGTTRVAR